MRSLKFRADKIELRSFAANQTRISNGRTAQKDAARQVKGKAEALGHSSNQNGRCNVAENKLVQSQAHLVLLEAGEGEIIPTDETVAVRPSDGVPDQPVAEAAQDC